MAMVGCGSDRSALSTAPTITAAGAPMDQPVLTAEDTSAIVITSLVAGTACPALQFRVSTYLIKTDASTVYEGGSCASLQAGTKLTSLNVSRPNATELVLYATRIAIQSSTPVPAPAPTSVTTDGTVTSLVTGTTCPNLQFLFGTYLFKISSSTAYSQASCADVKVGAHVYVAGTKRETENFVAVTGLGIKRDGTAAPEPVPTPTTTSPAPAPAPTPFETTVTVSSLVASSACPYREFMVGAYRLTTSRMTRYVDGGCGDVAPGATLGIVAMKGRGDTSVLVGTITFKREQPPEPSADEGVSAIATVSSVVSGDTCPALSFLVGSYTVTVSSATVYEGGMCTDIKAGAALHLDGTKQSDDRVLATRVSFPD